HDVAGETTAAIVHHSAGANDYDAEDVPAILRGIHTFHVEGRGWDDVGYNMFADKYGRLWEGRAGSLSKAVVGAHAVGYNTGTFGISVLGRTRRRRRPRGRATRSPARSRGSCRRAARPRMRRRRSPATGSAPSAATATWGRRRARATRSTR